MTIKHIISGSVWHPILGRIIQLGEKKFWHNTRDCHDNCLSDFGLTLDYNHENF